MERVEPIIITVDGKEYTLEFSRETVSIAERIGFSKDKASDCMMTMLPDLFYCAFKMHHPTIKRDKTDDILFNRLKGLKTEEIERLVELFDEPYKALINVDAEADEEDARKNSGVAVRL